MCESYAGELAGRMGADGGTIPKRCELVKKKKKKEKVDKNVSNATRWRLCRLSQEPLKRPIVACRLGKFVLLASFHPGYRQFLSGLHSQAYRLSEQWKWRGGGLRSLVMEVMLWRCRRDTMQVKLIPIGNIITNVDSCFLHFIVLFVIIFERIHSTAAFTTRWKLSTQFYRRRLENVKLRSIFMA